MSLYVGDLVTHSWNSGIGVFRDEFSECIGFIYCGEMCVYLGTAKSDTTSAIGYFLTKNFGVIMSYPDEFHVV